MTIDQLIEVLEERTEKGEIDWQEPNSKLPTPAFQATVEEKTVTVTRNSLHIEDWPHQSEKITELYRLIKKRSRPEFVTNFLNDLVSS